MRIKKDAFKFLFGPVPSRRLGLSLGVDLVPYKYCSFNCAYCECGKTTCLTLKRKEFFPLNEIIKELKKYLNTKPRLNYITFSGQGEPLLYSKIGPLVKFLKNNYPNYKTALLTNGTLLYMKSVRESVKDIDLVVPSLDAVTPRVFEKINKPHPSLTLKQILNGIKEFSKIRRGRLEMEIFLIKGVNDNLKEMKKTARYLKKIKPDKIQLNYLHRPPAEKWVKKPTITAIKQIREFLKNYLNIEVIIPADFKKAKLKKYDKSLIINILEKRPCRLKDLECLTGLNKFALKKLLTELKNTKNLKIKKQEKEKFYYI